VAHHAGPDIDWSEHTARLVAAARADADLYRRLAPTLVEATDRLAVDVGCGGGGMAVALAAALPTGGRVVAVDGSAAVLAAASAATPPGLPVEFVQADIGADLAGLRSTLDAPADLVWASAVVHHAPDQQAAVTALAGLLAPGGRLALAEGGLRARHLPWDVGVGEPGLEVRLDAAQERWFGQMRRDLPGSVRMPYGWEEALRRAGLEPAATRSILDARPLPFAEPDTIVAALRWRVDRLRETGLLDPADEQAWTQLLDPADPAFLGHRRDIYHLEARSVYIGRRPD
jgi:SAM-dependent methyltransferase